MLWWKDAYRSIPEDHSYCTGTRPILCSKRQLIELPWPLVLATRNRDDIADQPPLPGESQRIVATGLLYRGLARRGYFC
jgi:hypothetical protein